MLRFVFPYLEAGLLIPAPAPQVWQLLVDTSRWVEWGPSVCAVQCSDRFLTSSSSGRIETVLGFRAPFAVTHFKPGTAWSWSVVGIPATTHTVEDLGENRCRLWFGVPLPAFPYLLICVVAMGRFARLIEPSQGPA